MSNELSILISSLSEDNFRKLVQEYLKQKYKTFHVRIVDGPYDGGNDLEIFIGDKELKRNIQVTVQKSGYESKLQKDLKKSQDNVNKYNYQKSLDFYISQNIAKDKKNELILNAEVDYGVNLTIIDANTLEQEADNYSSIRDFTYEAHNINLSSRIDVTDKQTKILFDVLTLDHNSIEIKRNFINSYIFSFLYTSPGSSLDDVYKYINLQLNNTLDKDFLEKELNYLRSKRQLISKEDKKKFQLSEEKAAEISRIFSNVIREEEELKNNIDELIAKHQIDCSCSELVSFLYELYQDNYTIDIEEVKSTNNSFSASIKKTFNDLISFFTKISVSQDDAKMISYELLKVCEQNNFLNKLSSIYLFNNLYSSNKLEKYVNTKNQKIYLDTQILIRMICVLYNDKIDYSDSALQSIKIFLNTLNKYDDKIRIYSSYDYVGEVAGHLHEAFKLQKFLKLSFITKLGNSKNVFYNTFLELKQKDYLDEEIEFIDFVEDLLNEEVNIGNDAEFLKATSIRIAEIIEQLNIELIYHPNYPNYAAIKREYEMSLAYQSRERSYTARENDLRTILYLSTKENHVNIETGEINEPFLVTWDSAFYSFRKQLLLAHKELTYWYIYSPLKVVDRFSVMNFNLNPKSISLNIVALTETNFNYSTKTVSFIDVISNFFHSEDVSKLSIINKLINLKNNTKDLDEVPTNEEMKDKEDDKLTRLLLNIRSHYTSYETKYKFDDIVKVFELPKLEDEIIKILERTLINFKSETNLITMYHSFDDLITTVEKE